MPGGMSWEQVAAGLELPFAPDLVVPELHPQPLDVPSPANEHDFQQTYVNCFTAGPAGLRQSRMPMVLRDDESCIKAALAMCGRGPDEPKRVVRIRSTLHLTGCAVRAALLP